MFQCFHGHDPLLGYGCCNHLQGWEPRHFDERTGNCFIILTRPETTTTQEPITTVVRVRKFEFRGLSLHSLSWGFSPSEKSLLGDTARRRRIWAQDAGVKFYKFGSKRL